VLLANSFTISWFVVPGIIMPFSPDCQITHAMSSIARLNSRHDGGLPCLTPLMIRKALLSILFIITEVHALVYSLLTVLTKFCGILNSIRVLHR
jgi:hypothetical protein